MGESLTHSTATHDSLLELRNSVCACVLNYLNQTEHLPGSSTKAGNFFTESYSVRIRRQVHKNFYNYTNFEKET